ncbi:MAG: hypothetical protein MJ249_12760 [Kiritimatiellae bacterium]|nr:hypothetical protein [Kiritimatiellia bacterium]
MRIKEFGLVMVPSAVLLIIVAVAICAGLWLREMVGVLKSPPMPVEMTYVVKVENLAGPRIYPEVTISESTKRGDAVFKAFKEAESSLRNEMNSWMTILGFFGVLIGMLIPLAGYLLQQRSLSDERKRMEETMAEKVDTAVKGAQESVNKALKKVEQAEKDLETVKQGYHALQEKTQTVEDQIKQIGKITANLTNENGERHERSTSDAVENSPKKDVTSDISLVEQYRKAAAAGDARAQCNLGMMYEYGRGVKKDEKQAVEWYRKAADAGDARAQCNLGVMYDQGRGVEKDEKQAVEWFRKAAAAGDARAQCYLGLMYEYGKGVEIDLMKAKELYDLALRSGIDYIVKDARNCLIRVLGKMSK